MSESRSQGKLLKDANDLNTEIKNYLNDDPINYNPVDLEDFKTDILGYLVNISVMPEDFQSGRLTPEGIHADLVENMKIINTALARATGKQRKIRRSRRSTKRRSTKRHRTKRHKRSNKRRKH
jgi:hypothetical protein